MLDALPGIELTYATVGAGDMGTVREGTIYVKLKEKDERHHTQQELEAMARREISKIPGIISSITEADNLQGASPINVNLKGDDLDVLKEYSEKIKKRMQEIRVWWMWHQVSIRTRAKSGWWWIGLVQ